MKKNIIRVCVFLYRFNRGLFFVFVIFLAHGTNKERNIRKNMFICLLFHKHKLIYSLEYL
jgi:hypothetical protein